MNRQRDSGQRGAQRLQAPDHRIGVAVARAVVQVGFARRRRLQRFEPGHERRRADAAGDPDLARDRRGGRELEAAVRSFDDDLLPDLDALGESFGEIAERLDVEGDHPVASVGAGDGEGVSALAAVESDEGELSGAMARPAFAELAGQFGDSALSAHRAHRAVDLAATVG